MPYKLDATSYFTHSLWTHCCYLTISAQDLAIHHCVSKRRTSYWSFWEEAALYIFCPALFGKKEDLLSYDDMRYTIIFSKMRFFIYFPVCISCITSLLGFQLNFMKVIFSYTKKKTFLSPKSQRVKKEKPTRDFLSPFNIKAWCTFTVVLPSLQKWWSFEIPLDLVLSCPHHCHRMS